MTRQELLELLIGRGILRTPRVIDAFERVDRRDFVPPEYAAQAYEDHPLPIGYGQTISQPSVVAFMLELLAAEEGDTVMDVGAGSGWQSVLLAYIVGERGRVYAVELIPELAEQCSRNVEKYHLVSGGRVEVVVRNAALGLPEHAPFNRIIAAASCKGIPKKWGEELAEGGRIVAPVGTTLLVLDKKDGLLVETGKYPGFMFVPFVEE